MITIQFKDVEDVNKVLVALGKLPYEHVFNLIGSIQSQAAQQLASPIPDRKRIAPA